MIKAKHSYWARLVFNPYIKILMKKNFSHFYLVNDFPKVQENEGLIFTPNHFSWWDGFIIDQVTKKYLKRKIHIMMLEGQLNRYWFFRYLGCYSIDQNKSKSILETAEYTKQIINDTRNFTVVYPQGKFEIYEKKPVEIKDGLKLFVNNLDVTIKIQIVGFKIQIYEEKKPAVIARFGESFTADEIIDNFNLYKQAFHKNLDLLNQAALNKYFLTDLFKEK